ncbi:hypothetical protein P12x_002310 [Tundrisphaera lichenicola]|uniref:hypothetical protein n=1 Tax=Tundrisphaera lichenicola TaxID=2029860 RepID=UPI003EBB3B01
MSDSESVGRWGRFGPLGLMLAGVLAWLWPIGLGGAMPVGGDATQFSMGLMAFLRSSILAGRLPLWNDLWGFGFPGLAESQMGVYYPPHLLLYGCFATEVAYTLSLVLHTLWGALGARWMARVMGVSEVGSALVGFVFATCGMALIHLPHQWAYTVGSWMPWAWGLAWLVARGEGSPRTPWLLAAVLTIQVLPGHFQIAFITEVGALVLALSSGRRAIRGSIAVALALAGMIPLAGMQLWPTSQLARLSDTDRDFEYLSGFAATPIHLVSYLAPGLFHRSPLWRPVAWDTFHTSPEEHLAYVGLIPLFLALGAIRRGWREPSTRAILAAAAVTCLLSLGPYVPGFEGLIRLPGFSFFRAPARWGLGTALALAILAGQGFDRIPAWPRPGRSAVRFAGLSVLAVALVILGFELALVGSRKTGLPSVAPCFELGLQSLPWAGEPRERTFREVMADAYLPQNDFRVQSSLARLDGKPAPPPGPTLAGTRSAIYRRELGESGLLIAGLLAASALARRPRAFAAALVTLTLADALLMARHRPFDLGPARPLVEQSPVLARLAREPRGTRTLDSAQNLFMVAGAAPVSAYRTLDLPSPGGLLRLAEHRSAHPEGPAAFRAVGASLRVLGPAETRGFSPRALDEWVPDAQIIKDPALAGWLYGVDLASAVKLRDFSVAPAPSEPHQAWLVGATGLETANGMTDPGPILAALRTASPLPLRSDVPERAEVEVRVAAPGPATVVLSRTFDPEWRARWSGPSGDRPAKVVRVLGGWQGVKVPEPGRWTLHLDYPGRAAWLGLTVSSIAWSVWLLGYIRSRTPPIPKDINE